MGDNEYVYENNNYDPFEGMSEEERAAYIAQEEAEIAEEDRQFRERQLAGLRKRSTAKRIARFLGRQPGTRRLLSKAKGTLNAKRKAEARRQKIRNTVTAARREFKEFVNNAANERFFPNAHYNSMLEEARTAQERGNIDEAISIIQQVEEGKAAKASFKVAQVNALRQAFRNSAPNNAGLYRETRKVLASEPPMHRQTVLKIAALDDLMLNEKKKLKLATTNSEREKAAARLYNIVELQKELDAARQEDEMISPEQNRRYSNLVAGIDFASLNSSLYPRLVANNAKITAAEAEFNAAREEKYKTLRNQMNAMRNNSDSRQKITWLGALEEALHIVNLQDTSTNEAKKAVDDEIAKLTALKERVTAAITAKTRLSYEDMAAIFKTIREYRLEKDKLKSLYPRLTANKETFNQRNYEASLAAQALKSQGRVLGSAAAPRATEKQVATARAARLAVLNKPKKGGRTHKRKN